MDAKGRTSLKAAMQTQLAELLGAAGFTPHKVAEGLAVEVEVDGETAVVCVDAVVKKAYDLDEALQAQVEREAKAVERAEKAAAKATEKAAKAKEKE